MMRSGCHKLVDVVEWMFPQSLSEKEDRQSDGKATLEAMLMV